MSITATLTPHLPYLRRYARALTGSQSSGDTYVRALLEAMLEGNVALDSGVPPRLALYKAFHILWSTTGGKLPTTPPFEAATSVEDRLQALQPDNREALLLTAVEGFRVAEVATILDCKESEVEDAITAALRAIDDDLASRVLIIEDETIIALDLENLVRETGHQAVGIATTCDEAIQLAKVSKPDLVLTDIQLADDSSGIDAAAEILREFDIPVIFITAYPERLLTGQRPEPTYLISKPFSRDTVKATIGQALFFHKPISPKAAPRHRPDAATIEAAPGKMP
jgi:DNA-directed RNA polymerase specialized sigma24 family protein/CheY-like chemotaxis protein